MRRNFTQFLFALILMTGMTTVSIAQCEFEPPEGSVYSWRFDGGLEGWQSLDAIGEPTTAGWAWDETGDLKKGAFSLNLPDVIDSESQCNGAVVFDSDFLDNGGDDTAFGTGDCPADCNGYLQSPPMDLSNVSGVELQFTQYSRNFQSEYFIYVSIDGGATNADTIEINQGYATNNFYPTETLTVPLCAAANQSNVVITFHWVANYYVWAIDDVHVFEAEPSVNMRVNSNFYAKVGNFSTPFNMGRQGVPLVDIENLTVFPSPETSVDFSISDSDGNQTYTSSLGYPSVPGCSTDENKIFPAPYFDMPTTVGDYTLDYTINAEGDLDLEDNSLSAGFRISENEFRKLPSQEEVGEFLSGVRYGSGFVSWGSYFYIPQNDQEQYIDSVSLGIITNAGVTPSTGIITVGIYQWIDLDILGEINEGELIKLGQEIIFVEPNSPEFIQWTVGVRQPDGSPIVPEPGAQIVVLGHSAPFDGNTNYFFNAVNDDSFPGFSQGATNLAQSEAELIGASSSFASQDSASGDEEDQDNRTLFSTDGFWTFDVSMLLSPVVPVSSEDINENLGITVFPTPATTQFFVDVNLKEVSSNVSVELIDMAGNKISQTNYTNIKNQKLTVDVSTLTAGMYLVNIRTDEGMTSKKVSVVR